MSDNVLPFLGRDDSEMLSDLGRAAATAWQSVSHLGHADAMAALAIAVGTFAEDADELADLIPMIGAVFDRWNRRG